MWQIPWKGWGQDNPSQETCALRFLVKYRKNQASTKTIYVSIIFLRSSLLKWHVIYCNTPSIKEDMNELVSGFRWILLKFGGALSNRPIMHYHWIMHYWGAKCCHLIGSYNVFHVQSLSGGSGIMEYISYITKLMSPHISLYSSGKIICTPPNLTFNMY